jgi:hypothetical protein
MTSFLKILIFFCYHPQDTTPKKVKITYFHWGPFKLKILLLFVEFNKFIRYRNYIN